MIQISLLGSLHVLFNHVPVDGLRGQRVRSIFTYLILHAETAVSRSELAGILWPNISESQARTNLRRELHSLKHVHQAIDACITSSKHTVTWHMPPDYTCDIEQFERLCQTFAIEQDSSTKSSIGLQAVALYRDQLMPGISDEWLSIKRETLHRQWNLLSEHLIRLLQDSCEPEQIIDIAARQLSFDPYLEAAYIAMMEAYIVSGNSAMALHTYHQCASVLKKDLNTSPNARIQNIYERLISAAHAQEEQNDAKNLSLKEHSELVGRSKTLAEFTEFIERSFGGAPRVAFITGESGIGKSRLADEVLNSDRLNQLIKVRSECHPARTESVFGPFKDWFTYRHFVNACKNLNELGDETLQHIFPQLASYVTVPTNKKNRPLRSQEEIFSALSNIVCTVAEFYSAGQHAKLLLYIDDMQWADTDFFNWLKYFLTNQKEVNVVFLASVRTEEMDTVNNISGFISDFSLSNQSFAKQLPYLNRVDSCELINNQLANYTDTNVIQIDPDKLYDLVQGNPLFLIESINHLMNESLPQVISGYGNLGAAPKIYNLLKRRVDLLEENSRHLLLQASVIQRQFSLPLIQAVTRFSDSELMDSLDSLWQKGMLREVNRGEYDFTHDSLREACYASLSSPKKCIMHGQIAKALEYLNSEQQESHAGEIAAHYEKAGNMQTALNWFERALTHSRSSLAASSCIEYGQRCLQLLDANLPIANRAGRQVNILTGLCVGYALKEGFGSKNLSLICKKIEALLPYVDDPEVRWIAVFRLRMTATFSYQTYRALRLTALQLAVANEADSLTHIIEAHKSRAFVLYQLGRFPESLNFLESGLTIALSAESQGKLDRHRPSWSLAMLSKIRIQVLYLTGQFNDAVSENQVGYNHEHCVGDPYVRSMVYLWEAKNHLIRNRPTDVARIGSEIVNVGLEEQLIHVQYLGRFFCDWAKWKKGNPQAAIAGLIHTITTHESLENNLLLSLWYHTLAEMQYSVQQFDEALQSNSKAIQAARHTRVFNRKADIYRMRANILAATSYNPTEIIRLYDLSLATSLKQSALIYAVKTLVDKLIFLRKHKLPSQADARQLKQILSRVQISDDFSSLAVAQRLLEEPPTA